MDPVEALQEIAFWLERERAKTYRVEAFRNAATAIAGLTVDELAARRASLTSMHGVGPRTAEVITQAVRGEVPARLARLEREHAGPLVPGGRNVRAALQGDLVHEGVVYDVEVDTTHTESLLCARAIAAHVG